jgi:WS/DGAT/MGAT family acyltransferase
MELLRQRVDSEIGRSFQRLTQIPDGRNRRWLKATKFDVADHISLVRSPLISDIPSLLKRASQEFARPLDRLRPLWRIVVISGESPSSAGSEPVTGLLFLLHHSIADGLGALEALYAFCSEPLHRTRSDLVATEDESLSDWGAAGGRLKRIIVSARCVRQLLFEAIVPPGASPLNGPNSTERVGALFRFPRREMRRIGFLLNGSLHDVLMTLLTGALHRFHKRTGYPIADLRAIVPVSLRRNDQREEMGNLITGVGVTMPLSLPTPAERLRAIHNEMEAIKSNGSVAAYRFLSVMLNRFPARLHRAAFERLARSTNFLCTIIPAGRYPKTLAGARIELISGFAANNRHHGSSFTFVTYCHEVSLLALIDPAVVTDLSGLQECIRESFNELYRIASGE